MEINGIYKQSIILLVCLSIVLLFVGCTSDILALGNTPPDLETVAQCFQSNYEDIQIIVAYMVDSGYTNISIKNNEYMFADLEQRQIYDSSVISSIERILNNDAYIGIYKYKDTIYLLQWTGIRDIGCGIAFSIDKETVPDDFGYITELVPISEDGWYYYVDDYEEWRINHSG